MNFVIHDRRIEDLPRGVFLFGPGTSGYLAKGKVKAHYRKLPNGKIVYISQYFNKRKSAEKEMPAHRVVHADEESTTITNHKGEQKTYKHEPYNELSEEDIHQHLNSALPIDDNLGKKMWMHKRGIKDLDKFVDDLLKDEKEDAKERGIEPKFKDRKDALNWLMTSKADKKGKGFVGIKQYTSKLQDTYGDVTTHAKAYTHEDPEYKNYIGERATNEEAPEHERAEAKMTVEHAENAQKAIEQEAKQVEKAQTMRPENCPMIPGIAKSTAFFGHQAETLAKLNLLNKAIVDVDMGGGKGLILPADALNLMGQGKVKRPLIVVPSNTLDQNAAKTHDYTEGGVNVFKITNQTINDHYGGDVEKMVEDMRKAPPNTIFMASYDVFSYKDKDAEEGEELSRAQSLSAADFDYVALDEAHNIKNTDTTRFKSMRYLTGAKYKRVASGTFLSNNPSDALGQMLFLYPHMAMKKRDFEDKYGRKETAEGVEWTGLKQMRKDLLDLGMISLRRSAWIDKLPAREENLSVVKMEPRLKATYEAVLNDVVDQLEAELKKSASTRKFLDEDGIGEADELPPQALAKLMLVSGIADYPHEMSEMMEEKIAHIKEAKESGEMDETTAAMLESLMNMRSETRRAIRSLKGMVSPKVKDVEAKIREHLKDKKNGKYIVFVQRKAAANHIINNLSPDLQKQAVYYDASKKKELDEYLKNPNGAKILVAVDASIKEGVNMQTANGMYRYDHHWSPGNQEQSYARIWRFGQDKPTKFHMGIVDGSIDVPKYARLMVKLHQNQSVVSDIEDEVGRPAFKMGLDTLRSKNSASILPEFEGISKNILDFQRKENVELQKRFGKGMYKKASGEAIGGKKAEKRHGLGAYHEDIKTEKLKAMSHEDTDRMLGHFREQLAKMAGPDAIYDQDLYNNYLMDAYKLSIRQKARDEKSKGLDELTMKQFKQEFNEVNDEPMSEKEEKFLKNVVDKTLSGASHKAHTSYGVDQPLQLMLKKHGYKKPSPDAVKFAKQDVNTLIKKLGKETLTHLGEGKVENPEIADKAFAAMEKDAGEKFTPKYKKLLMGAAALTQETGSGWEGIKHEWDHVIKDFEEEGDE